MIFIIKKKSFLYMFLYFSLLFVCFLLFYSFGLNLFCFYFLYSLLSLSQLAWVTIWSLIPLFMKSRLWDNKVSTKYTHSNCFSSPCLKFCLDHMDSVLYYTPHSGFKKIPNLIRNLLARVRFWIGFGFGENFRVWILISQISEPIRPVSIPESGCLLPLHTK